MNSFKIGKQIIIITINRVVSDYTFSNLYTYVTIYEHNGNASPQNYIHHL
jgi:hypothetical protein